MSRLQEFTEAHLIENSSDLEDLLQSKKRIDVISALDVLEHFKSSDLESLIQLFAQNNLNIRSLLIKVPNSDGLLFLIALWLAKLNISKTPPM